MINLYSGKLVYHIGVFAVLFGSILDKNSTEPNQLVYTKYQPFNFNFFVEPNQTKPILFGLVWFGYSVVNSKNKLNPNVSYSDKIHRSSDTHINKLIT